MMCLLNRFLTVLICSIVLSSCSNSESSSTKTAEEEAVETTTRQDIDQLLEDMPPPSLVPFTLKSIGAPFDMGHTHSLEKAENYQGNVDKMALNMGIYASDVSYLAAYGKEQECIKYLETAHKMAESLGESSIYDQSQLDEFRGHISNGNEEEISALLTKLFIETSKQMEDDNQLTLAGLALTGSFIEGLYQAVITLENYDNSDESTRLLEPLVRVVLSEEKALLDIIQVLEDLPFDETIAEIKIELSILDRLYKGDLQEVEEQLLNDPNYIVSKDIMRDITTEVKRIRASLVK